MKAIFLSITTLSLCFPVFVSAYELKIAPDVSILESFETEENVYIAGFKTFFDATLMTDMVSVAANQTINGTIFGDVTLVGGAVSVGGEMFDDTRIIANSVTINGITNRDLVIVANHVTIQDDAIINGDMLILANSVTSSGQFLGATQITANSIFIDGNIVETATYTSQRLTFGSRARVSSDIAYFSPVHAVIQDGAQIEQSLTFNQIDSIRQNDVVQKFFLGLMGFWSIIKMVATLFVIFILTQIFRVFTQRIVDVVNQQKLLILPIGFLSLILLPLLIALLFATVVLIPVSIILGLMFAIIIILLPALSAVLLASLYQKIIQKKQKPTVQFGISALMLLLLTFIMFIPKIGKIVVYGLYVATFGAVIYDQYIHIRRKKIKL